MARREARAGKPGKLSGDALQILSARCADLAVVPLALGSGRPDRAGDVVDSLRSLLIGLPVAREPEALVVCCAQVGQQFREGLLGHGTVLTDWGRRAPILVRATTRGWPRGGSGVAGTLQR